MQATTEQMTNLLMSKLEGADEYVIPSEVFWGTNLEEYRVTISTRPTDGFYDLNFHFPRDQCYPVDVRNAIGDVDDIVGWICKYLDTRVYRRASTGHVFLIEQTDDAEFIQKFKNGLVSLSKSRIPDNGGSFEDYIESCIERCMAGGLGGYEFSEEIFSGTRMEGYVLSIGKTTVDDTPTYDVSADRVVSLETPSSSTQTSQSHSVDVNLFKFNSNLSLEATLHRVKGYLATGILGFKGAEFKARVDKGTTVTERARYYFGITP
jgi:hypothetical protein